MVAVPQNTRYLPGRSPAPRFTASEKCSCAFTALILSVLFGFLDGKRDLIVIGLAIGLIVVVYERYEYGIVDGTVVLYEPPAEARVQIEKMERKPRKIAGLPTISTRWKCRGSRKSSASPIGARRTARNASGRVGAWSCWPAETMRYRSSMLSMLTVYSCRIAVPLSHWAGRISA
jgi:hypothetical protein